MKDLISQVLTQAANNLVEQGVLPADLVINPLVEGARDKAHGDFASNIAMVLCKQAKMPPRDLANKFVELIPLEGGITKVEIAGPGFINFFVAEDAKFAVVEKVLEAGESFGQVEVGQQQKVLIEYVSANPTGPLHVGHGRGAAYGASLASLMSFAGFAVSREYYVNDAGRQMDILTVSVWLRYLLLLGVEFDFPSNGYKGDYVVEIAQKLQERQQDALQAGGSELFAGVHPDEGQENGDKEKHIDDLIAKARDLLGEKYEIVADLALESILADIKQDLAEFGVEFDTWFSEKSLTSTGAVDEALAVLKENNMLYEQDGAIWFKSSELGDEKDRVVVRDNGQFTYFASDIAYHHQKVTRNFDQLIDIWGADHHGYIARVKAAMQALGCDSKLLEVLLVQFAILYRGGERAQMSTRSGEFVTLRELREEVGNDAARFFYTQRKSEQHMDFDLDLAKSKSNENPVFYIQYAHARIASVFRQLAERSYKFDQTEGLANLDKLTNETAANLATQLANFPNIIGRAALAREPHQVAYFLRELAHSLHSYYNNEQFVVEDSALRNAHLVLIKAVQQVLQNGLRILGVSAPEKM